MPTSAFRLRVFAFVAGIAVSVVCAAASADPPSRVARLGYTSGAVSLSPAGENDWVLATINRPLVNGDRLWADAGARAELQDGGALIRLNSNTGVSVLNLDGQITQLQLTQGVLNVRLRRLSPGQVFEVDTPRLAFTLRQSGDYRIAVDTDGYATDVIVRQGQGEVTGEGAGYLVDAQQRYRFRGRDLRDYEFLQAPRPDEFDQWAAERDRAFENSAAARYVAPDVVGYQDLDANGSWRVDETYGNVWVPHRVAADWAPYRDGHWAWIDPWGWTWIDDAPWGFAVSHYGRWANLGGTWCWVPGPRHAPAYYAPALVVFVGGDNFRLTGSGGHVGGVAWFPLAPREVYRPAYSVSRSYFENVNRSNTVLSSTVINNTYNTTVVSSTVYANRHIPGAVVAVPRDAFVQSQPVARARVHVNPEQFGNAAVATSPRLAPTEQGVRGAAGPRERPPARVFERPVVTVTAPPTSRVQVLTPVPAVAPPPQRVAEPKAVAPQASPAIPSPPQRSAPAPLLPVTRVAPPAPTAATVPNAAPVPPAAPARAARPVQPRPLVAAPEPPPPQIQRAPVAEPHGHKPAPAASKPHELEKGRDAPKHQEENRK